MTRDNGWNPAPVDVVDAPHRGVGAGSGDGVPDMEDMEELRSAAVEWHRAEMRAERFAHAAAETARLYVRPLRERAGLSQRELARRAGISPAAINHVETGDRFPLGAAVLRRLTATLTDALTTEDA